MSAGPLALCFGVHNHQPVGQFDHVLQAATARAYRPFLERLQARPAVRLTTHWTGSLLESLRERSPATFDLLASLVARGQIELLTGGFYEPILAVLPDADKIGQIERLTDFIKSHFGVRPRGMWLAERVWEPHLPRALRDAGVEYVLVDDRHFALAGFDPDTLGGYYLTEEQGALVGVFPINQRLRYLIPFADVEATVAYLAQRREEVDTLTIVDDGEKFGVWPGTHALVYEQGWLDRFFDGLQALPWLELATFADVVDRRRATGRVYLPTASYREMGEWALPTVAGRQLESAKHEVAALEDGERLQTLLRGGFWRAFLVKYPEVADAYWKMLRLSQAIHREAARRPDDLRLTAAKAALWRGQANDAYWHGVFGGCYLPHLRRAIKQALLEAERVLSDATNAPAVSWTRVDGNGDGRDEIYVRTRDLAVTLNPEAGGSLTELSHIGRGLDLADVLARRPETYHEQLRRQSEPSPAGAARTIHEPPVPKEAGLGNLLAYDEFRRASLLEGLFPPTGTLDPVAPWAAARLTVGRMRFDARVEPIPHGITALLTPAGGDGPLRIEKRVTIDEAVVQARYRLQSEPGADSGRWAVQWNLALTAGGGPDRYLTLPDRPPLQSTGRRSDVSSVTLVDEWIGIEAELGWSPGAELAWGPVETVSVSEGGFERIYQGTAFLITWPLTAVSSGVWELVTSLRVSRR